MGIINNKLTFIQSDDEKALRQLRQVVRYKLQKKNKDYVKLLTPVMKYNVNGGYCFIIIPDGSKIGWDTHEDIKDIRKNLHMQCEFINRNNGNHIFSIVTIVFPEVGNSYSWISGFDFSRLE